MNGRSISGCLLSIFFWIWMIVSAVSLLTAIAGMLRLPLYDQLKQDVPIPYEMLPAYAVTFMAYLISLLGILRDKSWGLFGFVGATLAIVAIQVASGIPLDKSVWILTNVTFLVVLLAFNERHTTCESDLIKMCRAGLASEEHDPREALKIYQLLDRINVTYHLNLLLTSLLSLPLAYIIAYYVTLRIGRYQDVIAVTLMCLLGIGPIVFLSVRRRRAEQRQAREADIWRQQTPKWLSRLGNVLGGIWKWGMLLVVFLFADVLQFTIILLIAAVALIALMLPIYLWQYLQTGPPLMPHPLTNFLSGITLLITFVVIASDVRLKPFSLSRILQEIPIALKENSDKIFSFLTNITLWFILLGTAVQHEVMYENLSSASLFTPSWGL